MTRLKMPLGGDGEEIFVGDLGFEFAGAMDKGSHEFESAIADGERQVTLRRVGEEQVVACDYRSVAGTHADEAPLSILAEMLRDDPTGRLYKALVETKKAVRVFGNQMGLA